LSIPCKLVLNVVEIEETEALAVLKSTVCVSGFDSSSKFNHTKSCASTSYFEGISWRHSLWLVEF
ncbi:hypothetical protein Goshw_014082, partial [Gossypium schwendimanii]|nr:hypothetical protein [Gossypium schwendimanii]